MQNDIQIRVRYNECDRMGVLHHSQYLTYFEIGRIEMLRALGGDYGHIEDSGYFIVVVDAQVSFKRPARFDDLLTLRTRLVRTTLVKLVYEYELKRDETLLATGRTTLAMVDRDSKPCRLPDWLQMHEND